jgi:hypothetical protein
LTESVSVGGVGFKYVENETTIDTCEGGALATGHMVVSAALNPTHKSLLPHLVLGLFLDLGVPWIALFLLLLDTKQPRIKSVQ